MMAVDLAPSAIEAAVELAEPRVSGELLSADDCNRLLRSCWSAVRAGQDGDAEAIAGILIAWAHRLRSAGLPDPSRDDLEQWARTIPGRAARAREVRHGGL